MHQVCCTHLHPQLGTSTSHLACICDSSPLISQSVTWLIHFSQSEGDLLVVTPHIGHIVSFHSVPHCSQVYCSFSLSRSENNKIKKLKTWKRFSNSTQEHYIPKPVPPQSEVGFLCRGERAKTMLLHYNTGLVRHFVWRCKRMGTDCQVGELMLAGEEALYKAAIKWDPTRGTRFSTFAFQRVNRAIVGYLMEHEDIIKIPVNLKELQSKIRGAQAKLSQVHKSHFRR